MVFGLNKRTLIRASIVSLWLGVWEVYLQDWYRQHVNNYGAAEASLGYFIVIIGSYVLAWWVTRGD